MIRNNKSGVRGQKSGKNGFTLIETIITLVVLSIAAVGVLSVFTTGMKGSANPLLISQATQFAQGEMDEIFGEKAVAGGFALIATGGCVVSSPDPSFICARNVYFVDPAVDLNTPSAATNYKHVTVTITQAVIGNVVLDSLITNY